MSFPFYKKIQKLVPYFLLCILVLAGVSLPFSHETGLILKADARAVTVVGGRGTTPGRQSAKANTATAGYQQSLAIKDLKLDGIASQLAKQVVQNMTQSIVTWINSGFQGSPAFVTDLKQFLLDSADQVAGDFIYNDPSLNFLCSPFQLDVKIALATTYRQQAHGGFTEEAQCTLSDVTDNVEGFLNGSFNEGGWDSWFEVTQNPINTPTGAYLAAEAEMYARIVDEQGRTIKELDWGDGFLSFKVCSDTDVASGKETNCDITTPGTVIANQINKSLGAGQDALISADEINEIIGALFAQLAQQAITGINGMLGLGGSSYSNNSFGDGSDSFLDALGKENIQGGPELDPFSDVIENEQKQIALQNTVIIEVNKIDAKIRTATEKHEGCFNVAVPSNLTEKRQEAITQVLVSSAATTVLNGLSAQYQAATDPREKLTLIEQLTIMGDRQQIVSSIDNTTLELYVEFDFVDELAAVETQISSAVRSCEQRNNR